MKKELIHSIDWNKNFEDLSDIEKVNFCKLHDFGMLPNASADMPELQILREYIIKTYNTDQSIVDERGVDKLELYID